MLLPVLLQSGGGIYVAGGIVDAQGCTISNNNAHRGGGIYFASGTLQLSTVMFSTNTASNGGLAIWFAETPAPGSFLTDIVVRDHQSGQIVGVDPGATVPWRSAPGTYMPRGTLSQNFDTFNTFNCSAGRVGAADDLTDASCAGPCPTGHYCLARTSTPTPCTTGTYRRQQRPDPMPLRNVLLTSAQRSLHGVSCRHDDGEHGHRQPRGLRLQG